MSESRDASNEITEETLAHPPELKTVFLGGIFLIVLLAALRFAAVIAMPIVLAFVLKLVFTPLLRYLLKLRFPRPAAAALIIVLLLSGLTAFGTFLSSPAANWADELPQSIPKLKKRLGFVSDSIEEAQKVITTAEDLTKVNPQKVMPVTVQGPRLSDKIFTGTRALLSGTLTTVLVLFFLLLSGDTFLRRMVEILPRFKDKRQIVDISQQIEHDISVYLLTITMMNALVGIATGIMMAICGVGDPVLWGTIAFLLNYIPVLGPLIASSIFILAGLLTNLTLSMVFLPAGLYLVIHFIEGTLVTPLLLAQRFTLNPVLVIISLIFWYWMWGIVGAMLAVPLLAITKIVCDRIDKLKPFGHFLEG